MPLNGDVQTFSLAAIVQMVHDERKTGILTVSTPRRRIGIYFREGNIIHVRGNTDKELKLGALLKANNLISEDRLEDMLAISKAMEKRLGTVLLEKEYIEFDKLVSIIHLQFKEVVSTTFSWDKKLVKLGKGEEADVHIGGLFTPKVAATISRRPTGYHLTPTGRAKVKVNDAQVGDSHRLNEFDTIEIGSAKLQFYYEG